MYQFFNSDLFGVSMNTANWVANGVVALVAVFILFLLYKMLTRPRMASGRRSKNARLAITDAASIDDRRRLVLVRRDDVEHLIMIGGETDMVIEADISRNSAARSASDAKSTMTAAAPVAMAAPAPPPPPIPRSQPATNSSVEKPKAETTAPVAAKPATPVAAVAPAPSATTTKAEPTSNPAPAVSPSVAVKPPASSTTTSDASSLIGDVRAKPSAASASPSVAAAPSVAAVSEKPKTSVGDNMDALLTEITSKK